LTGAQILSKMAIELCKKDGITDSKVYLEKAFESLKKQEIVHLAITIEAKRPRLQPKIEEMTKNICHVLKLKNEQVGITATSGDGLTDFGCGMGIQCFCILTTKELINIS
jgi:2-C-methyl-D-erythritol 2,4-cyclodiphosphate synthase